MARKTNADNWCHTKSRSEPTTDLEVGQWEVKFPVKTAGAAQSRVYGVNAVGGTNDDNLPARVDSIHESQQCGHNGAVNLVLAAGAHRGQAVYLVKKDDGGTHLVSLQR